MKVSVEKVEKFCIKNGGTRNLNEILGTYGNSKGVADSVIQILNFEPSLFLRQVLTMNHDNHAHHDMTGHEDHGMNHGMPAVSADATSTMVHDHAAMSSKSSSHAMMMQVK